MSAQTESLHLQLDKTVAYPSDSLWFRGFLFNNQFLSDISTNLILELYDDSNKLVNREIFPISGSIIIGQLPLPKRPGLYWLRSYTRNSSFYLTSVTIRDPDKPLIVRNILNEKGTPIMTDTGGLTFVTSNTPQGISSTIFPHSGNIYNDKPFTLVLKYYDSITGQYPFILNKGHQRNFLLEADSLSGSFRGYASLLYYNADTLVVRQDLFIPQKQFPVELTRDTGSYLLTILDTTNTWNYSLSVSRFTGEVHSPDILYALAPPGKIKEMDTSFLNFKGTVRLNTRRAPVIQAEEMVVVTEKDSSQSTRVVDIDSAGQATLSNMYFFDTVYVNYMLNGSQYTRPEEIKWVMTPPEYPVFSPPDSLHFRLDTLNNSPVFEMPTFDTLKYLKAAIVTSRYADRNKAIDRRYSAGRFTAPVHFSFDLTKADMRYPTDILTYLTHELSGFRLPPPAAEMIKGEPLYPTYRGKPATFYLNEQLINWKDLKASRMMEIAYVKVIEDFVDDGRFIRQLSGIGGDEFATFNNPTGKDNAPSCMICIYTRKDKDLRAIPGRLNRLGLKGYDKPLRWEHPDRTTLLWVPYCNKRTYRFTLPNPNIRPFKVVLEGVDKRGYALHFEKVVE
ncbi:hypothetical protein ACX0G9_22615 [Flavitalea flava]